MARNRSAFRAFVFFFLTTTILAADCGERCSNDGNCFVRASDNQALSWVISQALDRNQELQALSIEIRVADSRIHQSGRSPNPELEFEAEEFGGNGSFSGYGVSTLSWSLSRQVETGSKRGNRVRVSNYEKELLKNDYGTRKLDLIKAVTSAYIRVCAAKKMVVLSRESLKLAEQAREAVSRRVEAGKDSMMEKSKADVSKSIAAIELGQAERGLERAFISINEILGTEDSKKIEFTALEVTDFTLPNLETRIMDFPDLNRWEAVSGHGHAVLKAQKSQALPDLTFKGGLSRFKASDEYAYFCAVALPIPFTGNSGGIREAELNLEKIEKERKFSELKIKSAFASSFNSLKTLSSQTRTLKEEIIPASLSAFELASEGYRLGKFGFLEMLDAQRTLFESRLELVKASEEFHLEKAELERLIGHALDCPEFKKIGGN
ncbi:MAG: TolC family protein [Candidatus Wallbacteria bacterium]|nr:TolC family protein [Candidatus Wallbacteria bacterium]